MQNFFDYACSAWYPSLRKVLQKRLHLSHNNCVRFCLQLEKKTEIGVAEFKEINWLNINDRFLQCVLSRIYEVVNSESPEYFNEIYFSAEPSKTNTRSFFQRLKQPLRKSSKCLNSASGFHFLFMCYLSTSKNMKMLGDRYPKCSVLLKSYYISLCFEYLIHDDIFWCFSPIF